MKFVIKRTSMWDGKPCKEAKKITVPHWQTRMCSEEYFDRNFSHREGLWRSSGSGHRAVKAKYENSISGHKEWITRREEDRKVWGVEVDSLEALVELVGKYGEIILSRYDYADEEVIYKLEIYDDYRE